VQTRRWTNQSLPQTLQIAVFLLYAGVVFVFLGQSTGIGVALVGDSFSSINTANTLENVARLFIAVGGAFAGYAIANERRVGWYIGIGVAALPLVAKLLLMVRFHIYNFDLVTLLFEVALVALLLHTMSRNYVRLWFK
jgi:ABC-type Na+ efflux pump permease subunit